MANIREFLTCPLSLEGFREVLLESFFRGEEIPRYELSARQWEQVHELADRKYRQWDWNYGESPEFNVQKSQRFAVGELDARIHVQDGKIVQIRIFGDFLGLRDVSLLEEILRGIRYEREALQLALTEVEIKPFFGGLSREELVHFLI